MKNLKHKMIAIFLALLIVSLTPTCAAQDKDVKNPVSDVSKTNKDIKKIVVVKKIKKKISKRKKGNGKKNDVKTNNGKKNDVKTNNGKKNDVKTDNGKKNDVKTDNGKNDPNEYPATLITKEAHKKGCADDLYQTRKSAFGIIGFMLGCAALAIYTPIFIISTCVENFRNLRNR